MLKDWTGTDLLESGVLHRLRLYAETVRHVRPVQIYGRMLAPLRRRLAGIGLPDHGPSVTQPTLADRESIPFHDPWNDRSSLLDGRFVFLNRETNLGWPPEWHPEDESLLWLFTLHYHQYLHLLTGSERRRLCRDWIAANQPGSEPGWHPYPLSRRIVSWVRLGISDPAIRDSLFRQASYLSRTVEWHQPGNHLLENARALALAGAYFSASERGQEWWALGQRILERELPRQILPDGGHMERSVMYHGLMLEGITDVIAAHTLSPQELLSPDQVHAFARRAREMASFLSATTHPDGGVALMNDSTLEIAPPPDYLLRYTRRVAGEPPNPRAEYPESGFFIHRDEEAYLIIDGGAVGPDHLPAHAHADIFTYELSLGPARFIVDTGVYEYRAGKRRDYARSTRAHNTVTIDGIDQVECWNSFRVARRYRPQDVQFRSQGRISTFFGRFSGFAHLIGDGIAHSRLLEADGQRRRVMVHDTVDGRGEHRVRSRIRLHPDAGVDRISNRQVEVYRNDKTLSIHSHTGSINAEKGLYFPEFGQKKQVTVLVLGGTVELPTKLRYELSY